MAPFNARAMDLVKRLKEFWSIPPDRSGEKGRVVAGRSSIRSEVSAMFRWWRPLKPTRSTPLRYTRSRA